MRRRGRARRRLGAKKGRESPHRARVTRDPLSRPSKLCLTDYSWHYRSSRTERDNPDIGEIPLAPQRSRLIAIKIKSIRNELADKMIEPFPGVPSCAPVSVFFFFFFFLNLYLQYD